MTRRNALLGVAAMACAVAVQAAPDQPAQGGGAVEEIDAGALSAYAPPACVAGVPFADITCTTPYDAWIEQFARDGITGGCGGGNYCPSLPVTRDQMAVFIERAMRGTGNWPAHVAYAWAVKNTDGSPNSTGSGTALLAAVASIPSSGNDAPSASNPWLLKVGPGNYDLGTGALQLPAHVALEGASQDATVITAAGYSAAGVGTLTLGGFNDVSALSVDNSGNSTYDIAIYVNGSGNRFTHVGAYAQSPSNVSGTAIGVYAATSSSVAMGDVDVTATNTYSTYGIESVGGAVAMSHATISVSGANASGSSFGVHVSSSGASLSVSAGSSISASGGFQPVAIHVDGTAATVNEIRDSLLNAPDSNTIGAVDINGAVAVLQNDDISSSKNAINTASSASVEINNCRVKGGTTWIANGSTATTKAGASLLSGTTSNSGTLVCGANYSASYVSLGNLCP